jgi:hypothetical protein
MVLRGRGIQEAMFLRGNIEAVCDFCERNQVEISLVATIIEKHLPLRAKIQSDGERFMVNARPNIIANGNAHGCSARVSACVRVAGERCEGSDTSAASFPRSLAVIRFFF